jgi:hypothetical protein
MDIRLMRELAEVDSVRQNKAEGVQGYSVPFYARVRTSDGEQWFRATGVLKNGNFSGFMLDAGAAGRSRAKAKKSSLDARWAREKWDEVPEADVPPKIKAALGEAVERPSGLDIRLMSELAGADLEQQNEAAKKNVKSTDKASPQDIATAKELGRAAFEKGAKAIPALDVDFVNSLKGQPVGGTGVALMKAWMAGWMAANLSAPLPEGVKTSLDRFSKSDMMMLIDGERRHQLVFTYESGKALYDVRMDKETDEYRFYKNNKPSEREPHHDAVIKHFGLHQKKESVEEAETESFQDDIIEAMARALFVSAWADAEEQEGRSFGGGVDLMDVAPKTSAEAKQHAKKLAKQFEQKNGMSLDELLAKAAEADKDADIDSDYASDFGHYLAMQAMGHGVSWFDDHEKFTLNVPKTEF